MWRALAISGVAALLLSVLLDPYTWFLNASDLVRTAPVWQTALGLVNAALLVTVAVLIWRRSRVASFVGLSVEAALNLAVNFIYVLRDGLGRFARGMGGEEYLSIYFVALELRVLLLLGLGLWVYRSAARQRLAPRPTP